VVVDASSSPSFEDRTVMELFSTGTRNLLAAEASAGVGHHVALSVVGTERLQGSGYFRARIAQEQLIKASSIPYSIVRATLFFERITTIADASSDGNTVRLAPVLFQPIAADDVVSAIRRITIGAPIYGTVEVAGPELFRLDEVIRWTLSTYEDPRHVVTDVRGRYFGAELQERTLVAGQGARLGTTRLEDWLSRSTPPIPMEDPLLVAVGAALREPPHPKENEFRVSDLPPGSALLVGDALVFNVAGQFFATQSRCPHRQAPLNKGRLEGTTVNLSISLGAIQRLHGRRAARSGKGPAHDVPRDGGRRNRAGRGLGSRLTPHRGRRSGSVIGC
jgi:hypothetical protein